MYSFQQGIELQNLLHVADLVEADFEEERAEAGQPLAGEVSPAVAVGSRGSIWAGLSSIIFNGYAVADINADLIERLNV